MSHLRLKTAIFITGLALGGAWTGIAAATDFAIGETYEAALTLNGGIRAPLLDGRWEVIGTSRHYGTTAGDYSSSVNNVMLAQIVDGQIRGAIYVTYNERSLGNGWRGQDSNCHRKDILHTLVKLDKQTVKLCDYVNHNVFTVSAKSAKWWTDSVNTLAAKGLHFPGSWLQAGIWASSRSDFVFVAYNFNPEFLGLPPDSERWEMSSWNKVRIAEHPERKALADAVIAWADAHIDTVNQGVSETWPAGKALDWPAPFSGSAAKPVAAASSPAPAASKINDLETKLAELKSLYEKKLISEQEYAAKRKALLEHL